jgi:hypothetical protein
MPGIDATNFVKNLSEVVGFWLAGLWFLSQNLADQSASS